jgi:hypothetical protein
VTKRLKQAVESGHMYWQHQFQLKFHPRHPNVWATFSQSTTPQRYMDPAYHKGIEYKIHGSIQAALDDAAEIQKQCGDSTLPLLEVVEMAKKRDRWPEKYWPRIEVLSLRFKRPSFISSSSDSLQSSSFSHQPFQSFPGNPQIPLSVRPMHIYVPGKTRMGKSTLLHHLIMSDIENGHGVCVMDGKGDFIPRLLDYIPQHRVEDSIYLDVNTPVPIDFIGYQGDREKEALIGELKYLLLRTVESQHAPLMTANITDLIYTLFDYNENPRTPPSCSAKLLDLYYFLTTPNGAIRSWAA